MVKIVELLSYLSKRDIIPFYYRIEEKDIFEDKMSSHSRFLKSSTSFHRKYFGSKFIYRGFKENYDLFHYTVNRGKIFSVFCRKLKSNSLKESRSVTLDRCDEGW